MLREPASSRARTAALALACVLGACTGGAGEPQAPAGHDDRAGRRADTRPTGQGSVRFGVIGEPATYDPYGSLASDLTYTLVRPLYPSLYQLRPDGSPRPYLASSLQPTKSGAVVTLHQARWSDGAPITAGDVVASIRRARPPSGFAAIDRAVELGRRRLELEGEVSDWQQELATVAFVLPGGRLPPDGVSGGPYVVRSKTPGLEVVYDRNPRWFGPEPALGRVTVRFIQDLDIMLALLERGRLEGAAPPLSVNLDDRLDALELAHSAALGWESIYLDLGGAQVTAAGREAVASAIERTVLEKGFVRDAGRVSDTLHPEPGPAGADGSWPGQALAAPQPPDGTIQVAVGVGDELTELVQRAVRLQFDAAGFTVELVMTDARTFYGRWELTDPMDIAVRRAAGAPGLPDEAERLAERDAIPLFQVATVVTWNDDITGPSANPTFEGPLWNMEDWARR